MSSNLRLHLFEKLLFFFLLLDFFQPLPPPESSIKISPLVLLLKAPQKSEIKQLVTSTESKVHSLKAAVFHSMAYKMSLEINKGKITLPTRRSFFKVLYNACQIKKKHISFEQFYRIQKSLYARPLLTQFLS